MYPFVAFSVFQPGVILKIVCKGSKHALTQAIANANGVVSFISRLLLSVHTVSVLFFSLEAL